MIREVGAGAAGTVLGILVVLLISTSPSGFSRSETTGSETQLPQTPTATNQRFFYPSLQGGMGWASGILPAVLLILFALFSGFVLSRLATRVARSGDLSS